MLDLVRSTVPRPADRETWLDVRRPYFNASAAGVLLNRHPFMTIGDYYTVKVTGQEQKQTRAMRRGQRLEGVIADWWAEDNGQVQEPDELYVAGPFMASLDRWSLDYDCPLEIKSANSFVSSPPPYWQDQCQVQMICTGAEEVRLVWFDSSMDLQTGLVEADERLQAELLDRAERFLASVEFRIPPEDLSYQNVAALHPQPEGAVEVDDDGLDLLRELSTVRRVKRDAGKDEEVLKDRVARLLGGCEVGRYHGHEVVTWRTTRPTNRLDVDMLTADHPDLVEKYLVPVAGQRRLIVKLGDE